MTVPLRRAFVALIVSLTMILGGSLARADESADAAATQKFIRSLADQALVLVNDKSLSDQDRAARFRQLFVSSFDIPQIGQFVLGRHWKGASPEQRQQFLDAFSTYTVLTWSTRFKDYSGVSFDVQGASPAADGYWIVDSRILRRQGDPIQLGWRVHVAEGGWRITDILVEGVSMALTQRQDFASAIQSSGGSVDSLLTTMDKKIAELRAGK